MKPAALALFTGKPRDLGVGSMQGRCSQQAIEASPSDLGWCKAFSYCHFSYCHYTAVLLFNIRRPGDIALPPSSTALHCHLLAGPPGFQHVIELGEDHRPLEVVVAHAFASLWQLCLAAAKHPLLEGRGRLHRDEPSSEHAQDGEVALVPRLADERGDVHALFEVVQLPLKRGGRAGARGRER